LVLSNTTAALERIGWRRPPRPNQVYGKYRVHLAEKLSQQWQELAPSRRYSQQPHYRNDAFANLPAQLDHRDRVVEIVRKDLRPITIANACYRDEVLPEADAIAAFGSEAVQKAKAENIIDREDVTPVGNMTLAPSCFGLPHAHNPATSTCKSCPLAEKCAQEESRLRAYFRQKHGCDDPVGAQRRRQNAERVRRHRAKTAS
jgi:hypothetical protein